LNREQEVNFLDDLASIEQERSSSDNFSRLLLTSKENRFFFQVLLWQGQGLSDFKRFNGEFMEEALRRTPNSLALAASAWDEFTNEFFLSQGHPIPEWSVKSRIQEALGSWNLSGFND
jgi:hypothetical protein